MRGAEIGDQERQRVPDAAERSHEAAYCATRPRMTSSGKTAVVGQGLGKAHADASADGSSEANDEGVPGLVRGERRREDRRQRGNRAVHQPGQPGLNDLKDEQPTTGPCFLLSRASG